MKTIAMFAMALFVIIAMSGCIDDGANGIRNVTNGNASNDTNMTLVKVDDVSNDSEVEEMIDEPELVTIPIEQEDPNITVGINGTVNRSGLSVTCEMVKNYHYRDEGTDQRLEVDVRSIKLYATITATGDEIETGLKDWWIMDERGRKYPTIPHTDIKPMKPTHKMSEGDTLDAYLLFEIPGTVADFVVQ